ncbi:MAG: prepilin peptidase [Hydrogenoanaerobacterium sp.]
MTLSDVAAWAFFTLSLLLAVYEDIRLKTIPNISYIILLAGTVFAFGSLTLHEIIVRISFAIIVSGTLFMAAVLTKELGGGDVKLIACMMLYFEPLPNLAAIMVACCAALMFCAAFRVTQKAKIISFAFAPFLSIGYITILAVNFWR